MTSDSPSPAWEYLPGLLELMADGAETPDDLAGLSTRAFLATAPREEPGS